MPIGGLCRGYGALMGTSSKVKLPVQPCFWSTLLGKLLKQRELRSTVVYSVFQSYCYSLCCATYTLLNFSSRCSTLAYQLELCRGWKWYVGCLGGMTARLICCCSAHSYAKVLARRRQGATRACLVRQARLVVLTACT